MKHQIFLSYSSRDRALAAALGRELKKLGVSAFSPEGDMKPGEDWSKTVMEAIRKSNQVVVLLTEPYMAAASWIGYEVGSASALGKDIVVMKPSSFSVGDLPSDLAGWRMIDFDPASPDRAARTLVSNLAPAA